MPNWLLCASSWQGDNRARAFLWSSISMVIESKHVIAVLVVIYYAPLIQFYYILQADNTPCFLPVKILIAQVNVPFVNVFCCSLKCVINGIAHYHHATEKKTWDNWMPVVPRVQLLLFNANHLCMSTVSLLLAIIYFMCL